MNSTVEGFFTKNAGESYAENYRLDHGPRLQALLDRYGLKESLKSKRVVDVGGGLGFLGELLDPSTDYWVIDGAKVRPEQCRCRGLWLHQDLDHDRFGSHVWSRPDGRVVEPGTFDAAFCLETLEHLASPYHCVTEIKKLVKEGGDIYLSVPTESVTHNTPNPFTFWPPRNFAIWLAQMALPVVNFYVYEPKGRGWPAYQFKCVNRPWREKVMIYPKAEAKFQDCTILDATNL